MSSEVKRTLSAPGEIPHRDAFPEEIQESQACSLGEIPQGRLRKTINISGEEFKRVEEEASRVPSPLLGRTTSASPASSSNGHGATFSIGSQRLARRSSMKPRSDSHEEERGLARRESKRGIRHLNRQLEKTLLDLGEAKACLMGVLAREGSGEICREDLGYDDYISQLEQAEAERRRLLTEASKKLEGASFLTKGKWRSEKEGLEKKGSHISDRRSAIERLRAQYDVLIKTAGDICQRRNDLLFLLGEAILGHNFQADYPLNEPHEEAWRNFERWTDQIVSQFPPIPLELGAFALLGAPPLVDNFNNYGLIADPGSVKKDDAGNIRSFKFHGKKFVPPKDSHGTPQAIEKEGLLFFKHNEGALHYHDLALATCSSSSSLVITLCDGTGQYQSSKIAAELAAKTSHSIGVEAIHSCKTLQEAIQVHFFAMRKAQAALIQDQEAIQGTTLIQLSVTGDILSGVAVGDSRAFLFSKKEEGGWRCRDLAGESRKSLDPRDSGGRLSGMKDLFGNAKDLELAAMRAFAVRLKPGDLLYVCSDGGYDNFDPSQIQGPENTPEALGGEGDLWDLKNPTHITLAKAGLLRNLENAVKDCSGVGEMHQRILDLSQERTHSDKLYYMTTPLNEMEQPPKVPGQGKGDDMGMVFFQFLPE